MSLRILSTLAVQGALPSVLARYEQATGIKVEVDFAPPNGLLERIAAGETGDVAIITRAAMEDLVRRAVILPDSVADIAVSFVGVAVRAGAVKPDISTVGALTAALLHAQSIAYSRIGASGVFFADLTRHLGIAREVEAKATVIGSGFTAELAARGPVELAVQQVSELMAVDGVDIVGRLPPGAESVTMFSGGVFSRSAHPAAARQVLSCLRSVDAAQALTVAGLQPAVQTEPGQGR